MGFRGVGSCGGAVLNVLKGPQEPFFPCAEPGV